MTIKVGDRVRDNLGDEGDVLAIAGNEAAVLFGHPYNMLVMPLDALTPTPEPAPAPLTGAQVAQVLEAVADAVFTPPSGRDTFVGDEALLFRIRHNLILSASALRVLAQAERERDRG